MTGLHLFGLEADVGYLETCVLVGLQAVAAVEVGDGGFILAAHHAHGGADDGLLVLVKHLSADPHLLGKCGGGSEQRRTGQQQEATGNVNCLHIAMFLVDKYRVD